MGKHHRCPLGPLDRVLFRSKGIFKFSVLFCNVETIEAVEIYELVTTLKQQRLPMPIRRLEAIGLRCFDQDDPWPHALERKSLDRLLFTAFAIDLQEMHLADMVLGANVIEPSAAHYHLMYAPTLVRCCKGRV